MPPTRKPTRYHDIKRAKTGIPETVRHRPKWELALEMIDELTVWGHTPAVIVSDAGYGEIGVFRTGLTNRGIDYVVQVKASTSVHDAEAIFEQPPRPGKKGRPAKAATNPHRFRPRTTRQSCPAGSSPRCLGGKDPKG